jgi:hypothetical protein
VPSVRLGQRIDWRFTAALGLGTLAIAALSGILLHHGCTHMPPPLDLHGRPEPGTPRAAYCDATDRGQPWITIGLAAAIAGPALLVARRSHIAWSAAIALLLCAAFLIVALVAQSLNAALTI